VEAVYQDITDKDSVKSDKNRVNRGGAFDSRAMDARSAGRIWNEPAFVGYSVGFRVARTYR
jgi:formylglycine-generating enzyme required for sulfatase activity